MTDRRLTRRDFVTSSVGTGSLAALASPLPLFGARDPNTAAPLSVVCIGGHPDDPESGCGGTLARYAAAGHRVTIVYLTRGERGIEGKSLDEAARIRTAESEAACRILGATPRFFGQIDGATEFTYAHIGAMTKLVVVEKPDVILAHWPIDTHPDHQVASLLAMHAWMWAKGAELFFFEVNAGSQTQVFKPDTYVDISAVVEQKKRALFAHVSQGGERIWREHHEIMSVWRGREYDVKAAEGFVHHPRGGRGLPGAVMGG
jgi:LmbE family N-acetylglucosaminyl deacetylase